MGKDGLTRVYDNSELPTVCLRTADLVFTWRRPATMLDRLQWNPNLVEEPLSTSALPLPGLHPRHHQSVLGPRHPDIEKPSRLLELQLIQHTISGYRHQLLVLHANDVYARKLETLRRMHREKIHAIGSRVCAIVLRQHGSLEECTDARGQVAALTGIDQSAQSSHCLRITRAGSALGAQTIHQLVSAK